MKQKELIRKIKSKIPSGKKVYLDGYYQDGKRFYLWWYAYKEGSAVWIEYETDKGTPGRIEEQAVNFDNEILESVLNSMV